MKFHSLTTTNNCFLASVAILGLAGNLPATSHGAVVEDYLIPKGSKNIVGTFDMILRTSMFVSTSEENDDLLTVAEGKLAPGEIVDFHTHHNEHQDKFMIEGELMYDIGGVQFLAKAGDHVFLPLGVRHGFWNPSPCQEARFIDITPGVNFARYFETKVT